MASYAQISLINIASNREGGVDRNFEFRLLERDGQAASLPFDIEGGVEIQHGGQSDDILKPVKTSQVLFQIKTESVLADKLIAAESRQFYLTIRETNQNIIEFEGYVQPNFHEYDIYGSVQTVQIKATGELGNFGGGNASTELQTLKDIFSQINTDVELTRDTDFYMRTRYDGQALADPVPDRIWMTELGKLGEEEGKRLAAIKQIAQEFNFQVFQLNGKLIVADAYERFQNPEAVNVYRNGDTQQTEDLLITLDETNVLEKIGDSESRPTGQKEVRIGTVIQQRRLPQREESAFPSQTLPQVLSATPTEISYPGDFVSGDIVKIDEIAGTAQITPGYMPAEYPLTITVIFEMVQFRVLDKDTQETLYYDSEINEWVETEKWVTITHPYTEIAESLQENGVHYRTFEWSIPARELPPIPEGRRVSMTISLKEDYTIQQEGVDVDSGYMDTKLTAFDVPVTFNDTPDDLYHQAIATNMPGEPRVFPMFESDYTDYSGESGTMYVGETGDTYANNEWVVEGTADRVPFVELSARRKAELLLGSADRIYLKVRDLTQISLLNILSFEGSNYTPVGIVKELFTGFQHIWMKPAPGLEYTYQSKFTYTPEEITASSSGPSRGWVSNRIIDSFSTSLATGAIAKTTAATGSGLVTAFQIDRQNLLSAQDEIFVVDPFTLNRYEFVVSTDQGASSTLFVEPASVPGPIPTGSYIFMRGNVTAGVLQSRYATRIFSDFAGVGVLREDVDGVVSSLPLYLFVKVRAGWTLKLINETDGIVFTWTADGEAGQFYEGNVDIPLKQPQLIKAPAESRITLGNTMLSAFFHVDPGQILGKVEREAKAESIGTLSADRTGLVSSIALTDVLETIELTDQQILRIYNKEGANEAVTVDGDQTLTPTDHTVLIVETTLDNEYVAGHAWVREPSYKITGKLNITAGLTELNQTNISENVTAIAGITLDVQDANTAIINIQASVEDNEGAIAQAYIDLEAYADGQIASATASIMADVDNEISSAVAGLASTAYVNGEIAEAENTLQAYVDNEVSSAVSGLASTSYVNNQIASAETDIENYVDNEVSSATSGLATSAYVDNEIAEAEFSLFAAIGDNEDDIISISGRIDDVEGGLITINGNTVFTDDVEIRGKLTVTVLETKMEVLGRISIPDEDNPKLFLDSDYGVWIRSNNTYQQGRALNFGDWNGGNPTVQARIWGHDSGMLRVESVNNRIRLEQVSSGAFIELSHVDQITLGGTDDIRFPSVPISNPGGSNRVLWRDSNGFARLT